MDEIQQTDNTQSDTVALKLRYAFIIYTAALILLFTLFAICQSGVSWWLFFIGYLVIGVALNHLILKRIVEWHPMYNTIDNVASAKLKAVLFWPISYLFLLISITINKVL